MVGNPPELIWVAAQLQQITLANWTEPLRDWDIVLFCEPAFEWDQCHACLVDSTGSSISEAIGHIARFAARKVPVVAVADRAKPECRQLLEAGADALLVSTAAVQDVAYCLWSVVHRTGARRNLEQQYSELEQQITRTKLIAKAIEIIARQAQIPESAAMRSLRAEARNQRRSMEELAQAIIDAGALFQPR